MTAEDLYRKLGTLPEKNRRLVPIIVDVSGRQVEVKGLRLHPHMGNSTVRLLVDLVVELPARSKADVQEPRVMVKVLPTSAPDRRVAHWSTWIDRAGDDMFYFSDALALAERLLQQRNVAEVRVWDPAEGKVIRSFPAAERESVPAPNGRHPEEERPRRRSRSAEVGVKGGSVPPPRSVEVAHVVQAVNMAQDTGFDLDGLRQVAERAAAAQAGVDALLDPPEDWKALLLERYPEKAGFFWLDVCRLDGEMDDSRRYEYKTLSRVVATVERLLTEPVDRQQNYRNTIWVREGFGRSQRVLLCVRRGDDGGIEVDRQTEYNLAVRK